MSSNSNLYFPLEYSQAYAGCPPSPKYIVLESLFTTLYFVTTLLLFTSCEIYNSKS